MGVARPEALRWAWRRFKAPTPDHHPTGASPAVMGTASLSLPGCDCRPMGTSPIETKTAPRVFGYCVSKRRQELTELDSRDASKIRRGGRASESRRAIRCHVCLSSDRTACAEPLLLSSLLDVWQAWDAILRVVLPRGFAMGVEGVQSANARSSSDGGKPRRDGGRVAIACWLRLPSDGDKPHRNEERSACVCLPHFEACYRMDRVC